MKPLFLLLSLAFSLSAWPNGYVYRRSITIDHTKVPNTDQTNFPVLVCANGAAGTNCDGANANTAIPELKTVANGGKVQHTVSSTFPYTHTICADCILTDSNGTTVLDFEVESYSAVTGATQFWVRIPSLSHTVDKVIWIYYGNTAVTTDQSDPQNTWDGTYLMVQHEASTAALNDSTASGRNGTNQGTTDTTGKTNGGANFVSGSSQYQDYGTSLAFQSNTLTFEGWVNGASFPNAYNSVLSREGAAFDNMTLLVKSTGKLAIYITTTFGTFSYDGTGTATLSAGTWYYVAMTINLSTTNQLIGYVNGAQDGTSATVGTFFGAGLINFLLGNSFFPTRFWNGNMDEIRFSTSIRSPDWLATSFNSQGSPNTFYTLGAEETSSGGGQKNQFIGGMGE